MQIEPIACYEAIILAVWLKKKIVSEVNIIYYINPIQIYYNNTSIVDSGKNNKEIL